jgi:iron-sulfur cluster repair protein YtfE (RIC family)
MESLEQRTLLSVTPWLDHLPDQVSDKIHDALDKVTDRVDEISYDDAAGRAHDRISGFVGKIHDRLEAVHDHVAEYWGKLHNKIAAKSEKAAEVLSDIEETIHRTWEEISDRWYGHCHDSEDDGETDGDNDPAEEQPDQETPGEESAEHVESVRSAISDQLEEVREEIVETVEELADQAQETLEDEIFGKAEAYDRALDALTDNLDQPILDEAAKIVPEDLFDAIASSQAVDPVQQMNRAHDEAVEQLTEIREELTEDADDALAYWASPWNGIQDRFVPLFDHADDAYREAQRVLQYLGI